MDVAGVYGTPTCTAINLRSNSTACAAIYCPATRCSLNSSSQLVGVFSGRSLARKSNSSLNYDPGVERYCLYRTNIYQIDRWWENQSDNVCGFLGSLAQSFGTTSLLVRTHSRKEWGTTLERCSHQPLGNGSQVVPLSSMTPI